MNWIRKGSRHYSSPYQIDLSMRGFSAWIYSKAHSGCLGREIKSLDEAKVVCAKHKAKQPVPA